MSKFSPFYVYTQSLDNTSQDLMYKISQDSTIKAEQITDLPTAQSIMQEMNDVATDINLKNLLANNKIIEKIKQSSSLSEIKELPSIFVKKNQVVIKLKTKDVDSLNRHSPILILFTLPSDKNYKGCMEYISKGLIEFCKITNRHPNDDAVKLIKYFPLGDLIFGGSSFLLEKVLSEKTVKMGMVVLIAIVVLLVLKNYIS